ncbi:MAG: Regulatory protein Spx [Alphaproteobacteria bacterium]|nr:Regulatory protein Spx [Alphaproteobacteria bacterium]
MNAATSLTVYGIKNCDTVKKARAWLDTNGVRYVFHDYKSAGIEAERLLGWAKEVGWERLLNRSGTTFRKLADAQKQDLDQAKAIALMVAQPSMIRRPVVEAAGGLLVGFDADLYRRALL